MDAGWRVIVRYDLGAFGAKAGAIRQRLGDLAPLCWWAVLPRPHPDWAQAAEWARELRDLGVEAEPAPAAKAAALAAERAAKEPSRKPTPEARAEIVAACRAGEKRAAVALRFRISVGAVAHILREARKVGAAAAVSSGNLSPETPP